jgi:hypothetical protein
MTKVILLALIGLAATVADAQPLRRQLLDLLGLRTSSRVPARVFALPLAF